MRKTIVATSRAGSRFAQCMWVYPIHSPPLKENQPSCYAANRCEPAFLAFRDGKEQTVSDSSGPSEKRITDSRGRPMSQPVIAELRTAALRIRPAAVAQRVWERVFVERDRRQLGGCLQECWPRLGTLRMWMRVRGGSIEQALIDVAESVNLMDARTATWLRRELDLDNPTSDAAQDQPNWNPDRGELRFSGGVIRRLRVLSNPTNIQRILDEFQATGWPNRIDNPLTRGEEQLHQTLRSLNRGLERIRFRAQEGAQAVVWERV